jgi:hypothetical protein
LQAMLSGGWPRRFFCGRCSPVGKFYVSLFLESTRPWYRLGYCRQRYRQLVSVCIATDLAKLGKERTFLLPPEMGLCVPVMYTWWLFNCVETEDLIEIKRYLYIVGCLLFSWVVELRCKLVYTELLCSNDTSSNKYKRDVWWRPADPLIMRRSWEECNSSGA